MPSDRRMVKYESRFNGLSLHTTPDLKVFLTFRVDLHVYFSMIMLIFFCTYANISVTFVSVCMLSVRSVCYLESARMRACVHVVACVFFRVLMNAFERDYFPNMRVMCYMQKRRDGVPLDTFLAPLFFSLPRNTIALNRTFLFLSLMWYLLG